MQAKNDDFNDIQPEDLMAYLDGEASPEVTRHIESSPELQARVTALQAVDHLVHRALFRANCPVPELWLQYQAGFLSPQEKAQAAAHLARCPHCQAELAQITAVSLPDEVVPTWPERLQQAGKKIWEAFLLTTPPPVAVLRGDETAQQTYQAGDYQLVIRKTSPIAAENIWKVEGQLVNQAVPEQPPVGSVLLLENGAAVSQDTIDEFGYFALGNLKPGHYNLQIEFRSEFIWIENLPVP